MDTEAGVLGEGAPPAGRDSRPTRAGRSSGRVEAASAASAACVASRLLAKSCSDAATDASSSARLAAVAVRSWPFQLAIS